MLRSLPLVGRLFPGEARAEPPADAVERRRLEHRARALRRKLKRYEKALGHGCSACVQEAPSPQMVRVAKAADAARQELARVEARLAAGGDA